MPVLRPEKPYAELDPIARVIVDRAIDLLMEYTRACGTKEGLDLLNNFTVEQNRAAIIAEYDEGEIRLELQGELLVWLCYLDEEDRYRPVGAALRVKDCPTRN